MPITLNGSTGVTAAAFDGALDATDLTGNVAAARITNALNATGSAPIYACRAWVNFNGTGTVAIRASGNVSSITDNGTGDYTVNFTTAMPDANYSLSGFSVAFSATNVTGASLIALAPSGSGTYLALTKTTLAVRFLVGNTNGALTDSGDISIAIFR